MLNFNNIPRVTKYLLIINIIVFVFSHMIPFGEIGSIFSLKYFQNPDFGPWQIVTSMFTHGSFAHLAFNMFALFMFGSALERVWGPERFLKLYFIAGIGAVLLHQGVQYYQVQQILSELPANAFDKISLSGNKITFPDDDQKDRWISLAQTYFSSTVGASGAIYGVLVAFGMLFPNTELMLILVPVPVKAKYFIPVLLVLELYLGTKNLAGDNIAHFAHLGGALFGFIMVKYWQKNNTVYF